MSTLTSRQRKMAYGIAIIFLLGPIVYLGFPTRQSVGGETSSTDLGVLSRMRQKYDLGEATLGDVDPSSSAMNLVLLGLRGPAASVLHLKAIDYQEKKQWAKLKATVDSIILLQPHYVQIWKFQGWNLAYNVSREWDKVDDRFYWVKEGIKFLIKGTERNATIPILFHDIGEFISTKMGVSDEKKFFRVFFRRDPDERFNSGPGVPGPDPAINVDGKDSYLVARDWFITANEKDDNDGIVNNVKGMTHVFFRQGPAKAQLSYAETRAEEGDFDGHLPAWQEGLRMWVEEYGDMIFLGLDDKKYKLVCSPEETRELAKENGITESQQRRLQDANLSMVNFTHWRDFAIIESDPQRLELHKTFYKAREAYVQGRGFDVVAADGTTQVSEAQQLLEDSMRQWLALAQKDETLRHKYEEDEYVSEALLMVQFWLAIHQQNGKTPPEDFPLKQLWDRNPDKHLEMERSFLIETRSRKIE
jgi:hypothetical protein